MRRISPVFLPAALAAALALSACESPNNDSSTQNGTDSAAAGDGGGEMIYVARVDSAPFYRYGPAQASAPDWTLRRGEQVAILQLGKGYSRARLPSGMIGWIATGDFEPKEGSRLVDDEPPPRQRSAGRVSGEETFIPPSDPAREMPMPEPVAPPPGLPEFRL